MLELMATVRPRVLVPAAAVAAGLVLGCGGSDGGSSARATATASATQAPAEATATPPAASAAARKGVRLVRIGRFQAPVFVTAPRREPRVQFVVEQAGRIMVVRDGRTLAQPFLDISSQVTSGGEQGLLSMAFAPDYASSGHFYVYFTDDGGDQRVVEYRRASADRADAGSARLVLQMADGQPNHNGGLLLFGPGGHLYVGTGDGGGAGDRHGARGNAQNLGSLLGKILRIDPRPSGGDAYSIPRSNPFAGRSGARGEIYSYGLRNPWRFSFDRRTRDLAIGDVGQAAVEEIDFVRSGRGRSRRTRSGRRAPARRDRAPRHRP